MPETNGSGRPADFKRLYLSHCVAPEGERFLETARFIASQFRFELFESPRPWASASVMPRHAAEAILGADLVLTIITRGGTETGPATLEAGFIRNVCEQKPVLRIFEKGLRPPGCLDYLPAIWLDSAWPWEAVKQAVGKIHHDLPIDVHFQDRLLGMVVPLLAALTALLHGVPLPTTVSPGHAESGAPR